MLMHHDLLAERGVAPDDGHRAHDLMVGRGRRMADHWVAVVKGLGVNWVSNGMMMDDRKVAYGVMRDDAVMHDPMRARGTYLVNNFLVNRHVARLRGRHGRKRERDRRRPQDDQQPRRKLSSHGFYLGLSRRATHTRSCFNTLGTSPGKSSLIRPGPNRSAQDE
jgi:hypothetical protein